jgi:hypothetical protein
MLHSPTSITADKGLQISLKKVINQWRVQKLKAIICYFMMRQLPLLCFNSYSEIQRSVPCGILTGCLSEQVGSRLHPFFLTSLDARNATGAITDNTAVHFHVWKNGNHSEVNYAQIWNYFLHLLSFHGSSGHASLHGTSAGDHKQDLFVMFLEITFLLKHNERVSCSACA